MVLSGTQVIIMPTSDVIMSALDTLNLDAMSADAFRHNGLQMQDVTHSA